MNSSFTAFAQKDGNWWVVQLKEEPGLLTQARRLDQIPNTVRDALELFPEPTDSPETAKIDVVVAPEYSIAKEAVEANRLAKEKQETADCCTFRVPGFRCPVPGAG